jgi:hypothetical protein
LTSGNYTPVVADIKLVCALEEDYPGDMHFIPSGKYYNDLVYAGWDGYEVVILELDDDSGNPISIATDLEGVNILDPKTTIFIDVVPHGQPWGMVFDPVTNDFLFNAGGTYAADIFLVRGFPPGIDMWLVMTNTRTRYEEISALILAASRRDRLRRTGTLAKEDIAACGHPTKDNGK